MNFSIYSFATKQSQEFTLTQLKAGGIDPNVGRAMQLPSQAEIGLKNQGHSKIASNQIRDMEIQRMNPYYQNNTFPFGDSVKIPFGNFKNFIENNKLL